MPCGLGMLRAGLNYYSECSVGAPFSRLRVWPESVHQRLGKIPPFNLSNLLTTKMTSPSCFCFNWYIASSFIQDPPIRDAGGAKKQALSSSLILTGISSFNKEWNLQCVERDRSPQTDRARSLLTLLCLLTGLVIVLTSAYGVLILKMPKICTFVTWFVAKCHMYHDSPTNNFCVIPATLPFGHLWNLLCSVI